MQITCRPSVLLLALSALLSTTAAFAQGSDPCSGAQMLDPPRPEGSCLNVKPKVFPSPDQAVRAVVFPVGMDLHASPDIESRIVIRGKDALLMNSKDYSSPRGTEGYYVVHAGWSPDSQFFVYSLSSSGGHSPWQFPTWVYSREKNVFVSVSDMIGGLPIVSDSFSFSGPNTLATTSLQQVGSDKQVPVTVDLGAAIKKISATSAK